MVLMFFLGEWCLSLRQGIFVFSARDFCLFSEGFLSHRCGIFVRMGFECCMWIIGVFF